MFQIYTIEAFFIVASELLELINDAVRAALENTPEAVQSIRK